MSIVEGLDVYTAIAVTKLVEAHRRRIKAEEECSNAVEKWVDLMRENRAGVPPQVIVRQGDRFWLVDHAGGAKPMKIIYCEGDAA